MKPTQYVTWWRQVDAILAHRQHDPSTSGEAWDLFRQGCTPSEAATSILVRRIVGNDI